MAREKWTPERPWVKSNKKTAAVWPTYVCRNPNCKSYGKSHPNCKCSVPSFSAQSRALEYDAQGGEVGQHFCMSAGAHHPECEHFAAGGDVEANQEFDQNPDLALDHAAYHHGLLHALTRTGKTKSEEPGRAAYDHLEASRRGRKEAHQHGKGAFDAKSLADMRAGNGPGLQDHLERLTANPESMLEVGGDLGQDLPMHAGVLAAKAATAQSYFQNLKPKAHQARPLDPVTPPPPGAEATYKRQLEIAENPGEAYKLLQTGRLQPTDLITLKSIYPKLYAKMQTHLGEALIDAESEKKVIPYSQKMKASMLLEQPLDSTMTQPAMMACIQANGDAETTTRGPVMDAKSRGQPSAATQRTIQKTDRLYELPLESVTMNRKK